MIDTKKYNLIYYRKTDRVKFHGKRIVVGEYSIINSLTGEKFPISHHVLSKQYEKDEQNKTFRLPVHAMAQKRKVRMNSRAFREYLNG